MAYSEKHYTVDNTLDRAQALGLRREEKLLHLALACTITSLYVDPSPMASQLFLGALARASTSIGKN